MGTLNSNKIKKVVNNSFNVRNDGKHVTLVMKNTGAILTDDGTYVSHFNNKLSSLNYKSILIIGLGMGITPQHIAENVDCPIIDVLEKNTEITNWVKNENYLNGKINIIEGDAFTYTTDIKYDLILIDIWWTRDLWWMPKTFEEMKTYKGENDETKILAEKYLPNLNPNGTIYIPIMDKLTTNI